MSLPLLVLMVVVGITAIVAAVHVSGGSQRATLASDRAAVERFHVDFPEEAATAVWVTEAGDAAFLDLAGSRLGLVQSFGDRFLTRIIMPRDVVSCRRVGDGGILLRLADFTFAGGTYTFANARDADAVASRFAGAPPNDIAVEAA